MIPDNRQTPRVLTSLSCTFGITEQDLRNGTVSNLSIRGCFVKTKVIVVEGHTIAINLWLPEKRWLSLRGNVLYHMDSIGFGARFIELTTEEHDTLDKLVEEVSPSER